MGDDFTALQTEPDEPRKFLGFGRRITVPADEIHVVKATGFHTYKLNNTSDSAVYGKAAYRPTEYWLNVFTYATKLKTQEFAIPIHDDHDDIAGIYILDKNRNCLQLQTKAFVKLNPKRAATAAERVGAEIRGFISTVNMVVVAELVNAAFVKSREEIVTNPQVLAELAFPKANKIMTELGYQITGINISQVTECSR